MKIFRDDDTLIYRRLHKQKKFMKYKYTYLVISVIALFVLTPIFEGRFPLIVPFLFLTLVLAVLGTLHLRKSLFRALLGLGVFDFVLSIVAVATLASPRENLYLILAGLSTDALFLFFAITLLIMKIFSEKVISGETIKGSIAVYFLMGFLWAYLYVILVMLSPGAISFPLGSTEFSRITYFSFTTLTTLGYGDVTPVSWMARNLTILESTFGQLYVAVLIARLVGLHIAARMKSS